MDRLSTIQYCISSTNDKIKSLKSLKAQLYTLRDKELKERGMTLKEWEEIIKEIETIDVKNKAY